MKYCFYALKPSFQSVFEQYPKLFDRLLAHGDQKQLEAIVMKMDFAKLLAGAKRFFEEEAIYSDAKGICWQVSDHEQYRIDQIPYGAAINDYSQNPLFYYFRRHYPQTIVIDEFHAVTIVKAEKK
ncbi:hypothetical protein [Massilicoli timonensis]|uniref:Uncharacterized protein n=2 Tax=Massilicoli timonensis TaxID=2015901 RepID=A0ABT1SM33_9FIRM|nr:hypothetical protein [Massilicoli timonensis]MCQ5122197.1 hypothetical protein [Massilicoli timonensis]